MSYNIYQDSVVKPTTSIDQWITQYKEANIEAAHIESMATLGTPDECLIVAGPPRLSEGANKDFPIIGMINGLQYTESSQVQPLKAIGSRRHIFSKTNLPIQGSIQRLVIVGRNLFRALYGEIELNTTLGLQAENAKVLGNRAHGKNAAWLHNLEEDIFRVPFGLGLIYSCPGAVSKKGGADGGGYRFLGGEYLECCVLQSRTTSIQSGQTMIMEQVQFMADRVVPWEAYSGPAYFADTSGLTSLA